MTSPTLKLQLKYRGTAYLGWQKTKEGPSIQEEVEKALCLLLKEPLFVEGASRTDRGVHAEAQVAHCTPLTPLLWELSSLQRALNGVLPADIRVIELSLEPPSFHATLSARKKEYLYKITNRPYPLPFFYDLMWHVREPLHFTHMQAAGHLLVGTYDFSTFCNERALWTKSPLCTLDQIELTREEDTVLLTFIGDHFLYKMVRNLVGTLVAVGKGDLIPSDLPLLLQAQERRQAPMTAPASGLYLKRVYYV